MKQKGNSWIFLGPKWSQTIGIFIDRDSFVSQWKEYIPKDKHIYIYINVGKHTIYILTTGFATHPKSNLVGSVEGSKIRPVADDVSIAIDSASDTDDSSDDDGDDDDDDNSDDNAWGTICRFKSGETTKALPIITLNVRIKFSVVAIVTDTVVITAMLYSV